MLARWRVDVTKIGLLIVDDEALVRQGLAGLLSLEPDFTVLGMAPNGAVALTMASEMQPDVILMDIQMPVMDGIEATRRLLLEHPAIRILVLTTFEDEELVINALKNGAHGYLLKDCGGKQLAAGIRALNQGFTTLGQHAADTVVAQYDKSLQDNAMQLQQGTKVQLTTREKQVLSCLGAGQSNSEIAVLLGITEKTVRDHVSNILSALMLRDRTQAALWAKSNGFTI